MVKEIRDKETNASDEVGIDDWDAMGLEKIGDRAFSR